MAELSSSIVYGDLDVTGDARVQGNGVWHSGNLTDNHINWDTAYTHSQSAHAPSNAQANADILKSEIEAVLTGSISSHSHAADHTHANKTTLDGILAADIANWDAAYSHSQATHAPSNAQANADILLSEIEAVLIGTISSHSHAADHTHTNKTTLDAIVAADLTNWDTAYTHSQAAHAPSNAQKNSDILKSEIEAVLTGAITSHTHTGNYLPITGGTVTGNTTFDAGTSTTVTVFCDDAGEAVLKLMGSGGTNGSGRLYCGQGENNGGGIEYNGDGTPSSSGAGANHTALYRSYEGVLNWVARWSTTSNNVEFRGNVEAATMTVGGSSVLHAGNVSTLTRGTYLTGSNFNGTSATTWAVDATSANTASKVVARDASGNFSAGTITATLSGNASTATTLQTARTINGVSFNGSSNITISDSTKLPLTGGTLTGDLTIGKTGYSSKIIFPAQTNDAGYLEHYENNNASYMRFCVSDDAADTDYFSFGAAPSGTYQEKFKITALGNVTASGSITANGFVGNASTATTLQTARTINGVSFNGSANITVADATKLPLTGGTLTGNLTVDAGTSTTLSVACDDGGEAVLKLCGASQGTGRLFVGQSTSYGGGIEYNGDSNPASSGSGSDMITLYRVSNNVMEWTARNSQANNSWEFRDDVKAVTFTTTSYGTSANWKTAYDHSQAAHAPSDAQKNSDILKSEIEAVLTGAITSHTHAITKAEVEAVLTGTLTSHDHNSTYFTETESDARFAKLGTVANDNDHYFNYNLATVENATPQYWILCVNAANNNVNGSIRLDRTSGFYQAAHLDVIVSSGTTAMYGGSLTTNQFLHTNEKYRLVTLTYNSVSYVAIEYTGSAYPSTTGLFFTGRLVSTGLKFVALAAASVSAVAAFGGTSKANFAVTTACVNENVIWHAGNFTDNHVNWDTAYTHSQAAHAPTNAQKNSDILKSEIEAVLTGAITSHTHSYLPLTGGSLSGALSVTGTVTATGGNSTNWNTAYTHSQAAHAPTDAQKNSDITKAEIEAKLVGTITSHTHNGLDGSIITIPVQQCILDCSVDANNDEDFLTVNGTTASQIDIEASGTEPLSMHFAQNVGGGLLKDVVTSGSVSNSTGIKQEEGNTKMYIFADNDGNGNITYGMTHYRPVYGRKKELYNVLPELTADDNGVCTEVLSSNTGSFMTVSASSYATDTSPTLDPYKAFNNSTASWDNKWRTYLDQTTGWLKVHFTDRSRKIVKIGYKNDDSPKPPGQVTLYGSTDDTNWTQLGDWTDTTLTAGASKFWVVENPAYYTYYKVDVVASGANGNVGIGELFMYEGERFMVHATSDEGGSAFEPTNTDLTTSGDWSSNSTTYPIVWTSLFPDKLKYNITEYRITANATEGPNTFTVEVYSDSDKQWHQIDSRSGITWSGSVPQTFECPNSYEASAFRIKITVKNATYVGMTNIKLFSDKNDFFNIDTMTMHEGISGDAIYRLYLGEGVLDSNGEFTEVTPYRRLGRYESDWFSVGTNTVYNKEHRLGIVNNFDVNVLFSTDGSWDTLKGTAISGDSTTGSTVGAIYAHTNTLDVNLGTFSGLVFSDSATSLSGKAQYSSGYYKMFMKRSW